MTTDAQNIWAELPEVSNISQFEITNQMTAYFKFEMAAKKEEMRR